MEPVSPYGLTRTEMLILQMVCDGLSSKQIAFRLHRSVRTIEAHRQHIMRKLGVHNVAQLVRAADTLGLDRPMGWNAGEPATV